MLKETKNLLLNRDIVLMLSGAAPQVIYDLLFPEVSTGGRHIVSEKYSLTCLCVFELRVNKLVQSKDCLFRRFVVMSCE